MSVVVGQGVEVTFEGETLDDGRVLEYGVHVAYFDMDEGCCEITLHHVATVYCEGVEVGVTTLETAIREVAVFYRCSLDQAHRRIEDKCTEAAAERWSEDAADARARWQEDRADEGRWF